MTAVHTSIRTIGKYYYISLRYRNADGKLKSTTVPTKLTVAGNNKRKAEQFRCTIQSEWEAKLQNGSDMLVSNYFIKWLETKKTEVEPNTYRGYKINMENHIIPYFKQKNISLRDLKVKHLEEYYRNRLESGLSPQTIKHHHQNISNALKCAMYDELIITNPAQIAKTPKAKKFKSNYLNSEQVAELVKLFESTNIKIPVILGAYFGLRRSEILGLTWNNVDFKKRQITISQTVLQNTGGDYMRDDTKNNSSYRTLPMNDTIFNILTEHKSKQSENQKRLKNKYNLNDFVCTFDNGVPISPNYLTKNFTSKLKLSELPQIRLHDLRHSVASNLLAKGFSVVEVQEWLGHSNPSTTLNFYSHIDSSKSKRAICESLNI